ncbi:MAG: DMT family transporter [Actinobacteria bacterium]|nr:DMT family transporter [Actinomycetota bacterium]
MTDTDKREARALPAGGVDRRALLRTWTGAVLISFSAVYVRLADVEPVRSSFLRAAYALPAFVVLVVLARRRAGRPALGGLVGLAVIAGAFLGGDLFAWHSSIEHIGAGLGTVLPNLQVVLVGVAGVVFFRERPRPVFWLALPAVLVGIWLLGAVGEPVEVGGNVPFGVLLGVLTAALYSVFLVGMRVARLRRPDASAVEVMGSATLGAALVTGAFAASQGVAAPAGEWPADGWLVLLALSSQVLAWVLLSSSIHRLPAALTSIALLIQPVLAMVWGALILGEELGLPQVAGAAIVLAGVAVAHRAVVAGTSGGDGPEPQAT